MFLLLNLTHCQRSTTLAKWRRLILNKDVWNWFQYMHKFGPKQPEICALLGILPAECQQMSVFIEAYRVSVQGQQEHREANVTHCVTASIFTLQGKQTGRGWGTTCCAESVALSQNSTYNHK